MKLRIKDNSIRFRLSQSEVAGLSETNEIIAEIAFGRLPTQKLIYAIVTSTETENVSARCESGKIAIIVPQKTVQTWARGEQISIKGEQKIDEISTLKILIEKDFACPAVREGEDESDNFPHPDSQTVC